MILYCIHIWELDRATEVVKLQLQTRRFLYKQRGICQICSISPDILKSNICLNVVY